SEPSSLPTSVPSLTTQTRWALLLASLLSEPSQPGLSTTSFSELLLLDRVEIGGTADFSSFIFSDLDLALTFNTITSLELFLTTSIEQPFVSARCEGLVASSIARRLVEAKQHDHEYLSSNFTCQGNEWKIHNCPTFSAVKLCVNCFDPCLLSVELGTVFPFGCTGSCLQSLVVTFREPFPAPDIESTLILDKTRSTTTVRVSTSEFAFVYCTIAPNRFPPAVEAVMAGAVNQTTDNAAEFTFVDLTPRTTYYIYCLTTSLSGATTDYETMFAQRTLAQTSCCKDISITLLQTRFSANMSALDAISVTFDVPTNDMSVSIFHDIPSTPNNSLSLLPSARCTFSPLSLKKNVVTVGRVSALCGAGVAPGVYTLMAVVRAPFVDFEVQYPLGRTFEVYKVLPVVIIVPALSSAVYSAGGGFTVTFSTPTNKAQLSDTFLCSRLFTFAGVGAAACVWVDSKSVHVTLNGPTRPAVGSLVGLSTSAGKLTATCVGVCPTIDPGSSTPLQAPQPAIVPVVLMSGPRSMGQCQALLLDLSASSGSGGRPFTATATLTSTKPENLTTLSTLVNNQLKGGQIRLPGGSLQGGRVYTTVVRLCNIFGSCGTARHSLVVTDASTPVINIFGAPARSICVSERILLTSSVEYTQCAAAQQPQLALAWVVLSEGVELTRLQSSSSDVHKFSLAPFQLTVGKQYEVRLGLCVYVSYPHLYHPHSCADHPHPPTTLRQPPTYIHNHPQPCNNHPHPSTTTHNPAPATHNH
ncbi:hypothetical protein B484DRAFT_260809, partial [Ochromonadaceae sp. CCMP2298]